MRAAEIKLPIKMLFVTNIIYFYNDICIFQNVSEPAVTTYSFGL